MKVLSCISFLVWQLTPIQAQKVDFQPSLSVAFQKAMLEDKLVFIEYYNEHCPVCEKLEPLFSDSLVKTFYNKNFISYKLNTENIKPEDKAFMDDSGLKPESVPLFLFFDKNKKFIHFAHTQQNAKVLVEIGEDALNPNEQSANLEEKYQNGNRSIKVLYAYSNLTQLKKNDSLTAILAEDLFKSFPTKNLGNKKSYTILKNCVYSIDNGFFQHFINHLDQLEGFETGKRKGKEKDVLIAIISKSISTQAAKQWDLTKIQSVKAMISQVGMSENPDVYFWQQEIPLYLNAGQNEAAIALLQNLLIHPKTDFNAALYYLKASNDFFKNKKDRLILQQMLNSLTEKAQSDAEKKALDEIKTLFLQNN